MSDSLNNENFTQVKRYNGEEILKELKFNSAVRVKTTLDVTTWLVETLDGDKILIEVRQGYSGSINNPTYHYTTYHGSNVAKFARQLDNSQSTSHHLLSQLV